MREGWVPPPYDREPWSLWTAEQGGLVRSRGEPRGEGRVGYWSMPFTSSGSLSLVTPSVVMPPEPPGSRSGAAISPST
jgi:hypothetical protein